MKIVAKCIFMISVDAATLDGVNQAGTAVIERKTFHYGLACYAFSVFPGRVAYDCNCNHEKSCEPAEENLFLGNLKSSSSSFVHCLRGKECVHGTEGSFYNCVSDMK